MEEKESKIKAEYSEKREQLRSFIGKIIVFFRGGNFVIKQSATYFTSPLISLKEREIEVRSELANVLTRKGYIKLSSKEGKDHGRDTITVTAKINVKP